MLALLGVKGLRLVHISIVIAIIVVISNVKTW